MCRHDLFNTKCQFAVFEEGSFQRIQYALHDWLPRRSNDPGPKKTYRGPHLRSLFPNENNTGVLERRALLVLDVPGLPEASSAALHENETLHLCENSRSQVSKMYPLYNLWSLQIAPLMFTKIAYGLMSVLARI